MRENTNNHTNLQINIEKSPIPIIWLDTSVVNNITKLKLGIRFENITEQRTKELYNVILRLTQAGKVLCPYANQADEVWYKRNEWLDVMNKLSIGIRTASTQYIYSMQRTIFIKAFLSNERNITIPFQDAFLCDPLDELKSKLHSQYYVVVNSGIIGGHQNRREINNTIFDEWEKLRQRNIKTKMTFEKQLENEFQGELKVLRELSCNYYFQEKQNDYELLNNAFGAINLNQQINKWDYLGGTPKGIEGLIMFSKTDYYRLIPYTNLQCNLIAHILTRKQSIKSGDCMDIEHISTMLPYSDLFITDKAMKYLLLKRNFNKVYNTKVKSIADIEVVKQILAQYENMN